MIVEVVACGKSAWVPEYQVIVLAAALTATERRCEVAKLLAHRALGHWGRGAWQMEEARSLACTWLFTTAEMAAARAFYGDDVEAIADELSITVEVVNWVLFGTQPQPSPYIPHHPQVRTVSEDPISSVGCGAGSRRLRLVADAPIAG